MFGNRQLGELKKGMEADGLAGSETTPFVGRAEMPTLNRKVPHVVVGDRQRSERTIVGLSIVAMEADPNEVKLDIWSLDPAQDLGVLLVKVNSGLYVPVDDLPQSAHNYALRLHLETGKGSFVAYSDGDPTSHPDDRTPDVEQGFDMNLLDLSLLRATFQSRRAGFALALTGELLEAVRLPQVKGS